MQPCLSNYTIPRVVQLKTIVLYCRRNARFPVHTIPPRKFSECAARFFIRPRDPPWYVRLVLMTFLTGTEDNSHRVLTLEIVQYKSYSIQLKTACTLNFCPRHFRNKVHRLGTVISGTIRMFRCCHCIIYPMRRQVSIHAFCSLLTAFLRKMSEQNLLSLTALQLISGWVNHQLPPVK